MLERALIVTLIIIGGTLILEAIRRLLNRSVNKTLNNELLKENLQNKSTILSDLESDAVNRMKKELLQLFEVNNNKDITIMDCIIKNDYENKQTLISNGKILGFTL